MLATLTLAFLFHPFPSLSLSANLMTAHALTEVVVLTTRRRR